MSKFKIVFQGCSQMGQLDYSPEAHQMDTSGEGLKASLWLVQIGERLPFCRSFPGRAIQDCSLHGSSHHCLGSCFRFGALQGGVLAPESSFEEPSYLGPCRGDPTWSVWSTPKSQKQFNIPQCKTNSNLISHKTNLIPADLHSIFVFFKSEELRLCWFLYIHLDYLQYTDCQNCHFSSFYLLKLIFLCLAIGLMSFSSSLLQNSHVRYRSLGLDRLTSPRTLHWMEAGTKVSIDLVRHLNS